MYIASIYSSGYLFKQKTKYGIFINNRFKKIKVCAKMSIVF